MMSSAPVWEPSATKGVIKHGVRRQASLAELIGLCGCLVRIEIDPAEVRLLEHGAFRETLRIPVVVHDRLIAAGVSSVASQPLDGVDLVPYFTGKKTGDPHEMLFWRMNDRNTWAVRDGDHKLVRQFGKLAFYDLTSDVSESKDLKGKLPEVRDRLQKAYDEWAASLPEPLWTVFQRTGLFTRPGWASYGALPRARLGNLHDHER